MANVEYAFPVEKIHGKIGKAHKIGFAHRNQSGLNYTTVYGKRSTPYTDDELAIQSSFSNIAKAVAARMKNPDTLVQDQQAFREQSQYKTFRKYLWAVVSADM